MRVDTSPTQLGEFIKLPKGRFLLVLRQVAACFQRAAFF
jgi:hypothetical protein